jgi:hypothetical protein
VGRNKLHSQELEGLATASKLLLAKARIKESHADKTGNGA